MGTMRDGYEAAVDFEHVKALEDDAIKTRRAARGIDHLPGEPAGLALSGGGIRSAATCLGAIQALSVDGRFSGFDYLSTVSGGGYTGACLSAAMSKSGGNAYPFGADVKDSPVVAHIRNYSNYLMPRSRSAIRNLSEAAAIVLRGLLANAVCVLAFLLLAVGVTLFAFPATSALNNANFVSYIFIEIAKTLGAQITIPPDFILPMVAGGAFAILLIIWAMLRSLPALDRLTSDTSSSLLTSATVMLGATLILLFLDLQPLAIQFLATFGAVHPPPDWIKVLASALGAFGGAISALSSMLGKFLETSKRSTSLVTMGLRIATSAALIIAALILPVLIWLSYIVLSAWAIRSPSIQLSALPSLSPLTPSTLVWTATGICWAIMLGLRSNGYSLHRLYRDRLSKAFLVSTADPNAVRSQASGRLAATAQSIGDLPPLDAMRLSTLQDSNGPYPLINAALNVQGSLAANKRGRNADFFVFTPNYIGSDLTGYAPTYAVEAKDGRVDLASAMAISGAAASANMGGKTIRVLSPTLSLLNIRLGYYLRNPRYIGEIVTGWARLKVWLATKADRCFLFIEMFNGLSETRRHIYLTDGGHIENLGIYSLLRRRCRLIVAIDAEADPEISCESLLKVERYARIDLGIRIVLPWEAIRRQSRATSEKIPDHSAPCEKGPHVAVGRIFYPTGEPGLIVYVKSSLSGDEKDYVLDYAERHPAFPHETTGDQFFSEEQFEMYRALGFHMVDGLFGKDRLAILQGDPLGFMDEEEARAAVIAELPKRSPADHAGIRANRVAFEPSVPQ